MDPEWVVVWIMLGVIVLLLIVIVIVRNTQQQLRQSEQQTQPQSFYQSQYQGISVWGLPSPSSDPVRSKCQLYQFEGQPTVPANPSLNADLLNGLTPAPLPVCYDLDQITGAEVVHTCTTVNAAPAGTTPLGCTSIEGQLVPVGSTETFYTQNTLVNTGGTAPTALNCTVPACTGILSLMAFNYRPNNGSSLIYDEALCLSTVDGSSFFGAQCDASDQSQLVRITRQPAPLPGATTQSGGGNVIDTSTTTSQATDPSQGKVGTLCRLFHRATGQYVDVNDDLTGLVLSDNSDFIWALLGSMVGTTQSSPQQIAYVGGLDSDQLTQFNGILNFDQLLSTIQDLNIVSIQLNDLFSGGLILAPFFIYPTGGPPPDPSWLASFMYVNYNLFGPILLTTEPTNF